MIDKFIELRGLKFHYREWGQRGVPMVLLHGLASQVHIFDLVAPLLKRDFHVFAFEQRGHGESAKPDTGYDFATVSDDLYEFLDVMKLRRPVIAGHSWGGNVALAFAARYPEYCRALVFIDGGFLDLRSDPSMTWRRAKQELAPPNLAGMPEDEFRGMLKGYLSDAGMRWRPVFGEIILDNFELLPDRTIRPRLTFARHMKILRALWEQRPPKLYARVRCPVLILPALPNPSRVSVSNEKKRSLVALAERSFARSETVWFKNTVHDIPLQRPRRLANVMTSFCRKYKIPDQKR